MIKLEHTDVYGWEAAIRGMRNPLNSWDKSDSDWNFVEDLAIINPNDEFKFVIGDNDHDLMMKLAKGGSSHAKYRRMITVTVDITAPLYWWKEFDTYKVGTVANSCSTMHKIHAKEFVLDDFSHEHLFDGVNRCECGRGEDEVRENPTTALKYIVDILNYYRRKFLETKEGHTQIDAVNAKDYWDQMIQLLPSSYNQKRTVMMNYEVLVGMYRDRKNHKLDEWHALCDWIRELPYSEIIVGGDV
jgi:hypothetical protein